jgi:AcrR family transcriptional regulator
MAGVKGQVQARGVARRQAILQAATEVFAAHGYRGGSLALVAERVGLTPAGVLRHFKTKEALLLAVLAHRDERARGIAEELATLPPLDAIRGAVRYAELAESEPGIAALFTVLQAEHLEAPGEAHRFFLDRSRVVRRRIARAVRQGQEDGSIRPDADPEKVGDELMAFMEGSALVWLLDRERSLVAMYRHYLDRLASELTLDRSL